MIQIRSPTFYPLVVIELKTQKESHSCANNAFGILKIKFREFLTKFN
jgi:hypothetical protein